MDGEWWVEDLGRPLLSPAAVAGEAPPQGGAHPHAHIPQAAPTPPALPLLSPALPFALAFVCREQPASRLEFVINDGGSDWVSIVRVVLRGAASASAVSKCARRNMPPPPHVQDKPAGGAEGGAANYIVTAPGTYRLKNGKLTQLA